MNDILSEPVEELRLVSDEDFQFTQYAIKGRIQNRYAWRHESDNALIPAGKTKTSVYGASMLAGLLWCSHCNHRLVGSYCCKQLPTHAYYRPIYRCYNGSIDAKECDGQTVYSARRIDAAVLEIVHNYFHSFQSAVDYVRREREHQRVRSKNQAQYKEYMRVYERLQRQQKALQQEVLKSLTGESSFEPDMLQSMLTDNRSEMEACNAVIMACRKEKENEESRMRCLSIQCEHVDDWAKVFELAAVDEKRMMLARIIEKIEINRHYHLIIHFRVTSAELGWASGHV